MVKVAINGFGRIGRNTLRAAIREGIFNEIEYVAINDPGLKPAEAALLFKHDSVMGKFDGTVEAYDEGIIVNGKKINDFFLPMSLRVEDTSVEKSNDGEIVDFIFSKDASVAKYDTLLVEDKNKMIPDNIKHVFLGTRNHRIGICISFFANGCRYFYSSGFFRLPHLPIPHCYLNFSRRVPQKHSIRQWIGSLPHTVYYTLPVFVKMSDCYNEFRLLSHTFPPQNHTE